MNARIKAARKVAGALATMATKEQILASFVITLGNDDDDDREYTYVDKDTERSFYVDRSETFDDQDRLCYQYFLVEWTPSPRIGEYNAKGHCIRAWDEPRITEAESRVGPNGLMAELRKIGVDVDSMFKNGGGRGVDSVVYASLEECAEKIADALRNNERYRYFRPLTEQEKVKLDRRMAVQSHEYWEREAATSKHSFETQEGLFKGCYNGLNQPLDDEKKKAILGYLNAPGQEAWLDVRSTIIAGHMTLWSAWCNSDPLAPRSGNDGYPSSDALRSAIRYAAEQRLEEIESKRQGTSPSGLKRV